MQILLRCSAEINLLLWRSAQIHLLNFRIVEEGFTAAIKAVVAVFQNVTSVADFQCLTRVLFDHEYGRAIIHI